MSNTVPITINIGALPPHVEWTPQQFADAIVSRMFLVTAQTFSLFVSGSTEPSSNVGPWLKNGTSWWVWSDAEGEYVPITIEPESLGYWIGPDAPDPSIYNFWIETSALGSPIALKTYYSGGWVDVYATTLADYLTITAAAATYLTIAAAAAGYQPLNANLSLLTTSTLGDIIYSSAANTLAKLAGNSQITRKFLSQQGTGVISAAPAWNALVVADIPDLSGIYLTLADAVSDYLTIANAAATYLTIAAAASTYAPLASPALTGTPTVPTAAPGTNTTQAASTAFVTAAVAAIVPSAFAAYPAQATRSGQTIAIDGNYNQIQFDTAVFNPAPAPFNTGTYRYIAPAAGYYAVSFSSQFDNVDGTPATMQVQVALYKNGTVFGNQMADLDSTPSPVGSRWSPGFSGLIQLAANDYLEVFVEMTDGVDTGDMTLSLAQFSIHRVQAV